jgi:hypothetical protein
MTSPSVSTECRKVSWGELDRLWSAAVRRASGFPRLVTSRGVRVRATSSSNARHRALNVEIATDFMVIRVDHEKHLWTSPSYPRSGALPGSTAGATDSDRATGTRGRGTNSHQALTARRARTIDIPGRYAYAVRR